MVNPISKMKFMQDQSPNGTIQGRYLLKNIEGLEIDELRHVLRNKTDKIIRIGIHRKKEGQLNLSNDSLYKLHPTLIKKGSGHISRLAGTDMNNTTTRLYGDIRVIGNPILVKIELNSATNERFLTIMVFNGGAEQAPLLYDKWLAGQIKESLPDNNITFSTENEQSNEVLV